MDFSSRVLRPSTPNDNLHSGAGTPLFRSAAYGFQTAEEISKVFSGEKSAYVYGRISNPTVVRLENRLAELSSGIGAVCFSSGMAAISMIFLALTKSGSNVICSQSIFVSTFSLFKNSLSKYGVEVRYFQIGEEQEIEQKIDKNTVAIFSEIISNPVMNFTDVITLGEVSKKKKIPLIIDSTVLPPNLINLTKLGASIIIHSLTKCIGGHAWLIGGVLIDTGNFDWVKFPPINTEDFVDKYRRLTLLALIRKQYLIDFGACLSPESAELALMGLETLQLRSEKISENAQLLAEKLEQFDIVEKVNFPGLKSSAYNLIAEKHCLQKFYGGFLSFDVGSQEKAFKVINQLKLAHIMSNLGDVRTLVIHPYSTIFISLKEEERIQVGVTKGLIRISVGIENINDVMEDFHQALSSL